MTEVLTFPEAAKLAGVSRPTIYRYVNRGWVEVWTHPITKARYITKASVLELQTPGQALEPATEGGDG